MVNQVDPQIDGPYRRINSGGWHIGMPPDVPGVDLQKDLQHRGIACKGNRRDLLAIDHGTLHYMVDYPVYGADDDFVQDIESPRLFRIYDPRDNVFAIADLAIEVSMLGKHTSGNEIDQLSVNGRGTDIYSYRKISAGGISGFYVDDMTFPAFENRPSEGHGNFKICFPQCLRNFSNDRKAHHQPVFMVFAPEKTDKTRRIGKIVNACRLRQFEVHFLNRGYEKALALQVFQVHLLDSGVPPWRDLV